MAIHPTVILVWTKVIGVTKSCVTAGEQANNLPNSLYQPVPRSSQSLNVSGNDQKSLSVGSSHQLSRMLLNTLQTDNHQLIFRLLMESLLVIELEWAQVL